MNKSKTNLGSEFYALQDGAFSTSSGQTIEKIPAVHPDEAHSAVSKGRLSFYTKRKRILYVISILSPALRDGVKRLRKEERKFCGEGQVSQGIKFRAEVRISKLLQFILSAVFGICCIAIPKEALAEELSYIQEYMQFLSDRDMVLSKNIGNADTPHYKPKDLSQQRSDIPSFSLEITNPMHISYESGVRYDLKDGEVLEIKPNGNEVHLEHEMMQKNENSLKMQESANLYGKARNLMKIAVTGSPK